MNSLGNSKKTIQIILLNDVSTVLDDSNLITGSSDVKISKEGLTQTNIIAQNIQPYIKGINAIYCSNVERLNKLIHQIKIKSNNHKLSQIPVSYSSALNERSFGVLTGSQHSLQSEIFRHSRICAENGETVAQVKYRIIEKIQDICNIHNKSLIISHSFACQILFNALLDKNHTALTSFWLKKGSMSILNATKGKFGFSWQFEKAKNLIEDTEISLNDIYNNLI